MRSGLDPFIVLDEHKPRYYMGLSEFMSDESILLGFIEDMADRYMREYVSLIPEWHLLPKMQGISGHDAPVGMLDTSYEDFFSSEPGARACEQECRSRTVAEVAKAARAKAAAKRPQEESQSAPCKARGFRR